jgi:xylulose-5-phosphate/fructose-6-phosphate phosphoketolase
VPACADDVLRGLHDWWSAANYLTVGQIYLQANPLLREPLRAEHIKPRLLGHCGTSPGLSLIYAHLNRVIRERDVDVLYLAGPGHGGPAVLANLWLEGSYSEIYPRITRDAAGMLRLFRQFSTPGGVPSHVGPQTPGSIHEGGELGYVLTHAFGAAFDNPDLVAVAVIGDGEAETGPLEGSWKGVRFLNPKRDGAVLPVLHANGYKISGPTVLGRADDATVRSLLAGHGYEAMFVAGAEPMQVHRALAAALDKSFDRIAAIVRSARCGGPSRTPLWPAIVLRTPKGWTGPKELDGVALEGTFRSHQVPLAAVRTEPRQLAILEAWLQSYEPSRLFDGAGQPVGGVTSMAPSGGRRMGANPHANGGSLSVPLTVPDFTRYALDVPAPGAVTQESTRALGALLRDVYSANPTTFRLFCPDETNSNRLGAVFNVETRCFEEATLPTDDHVSAEGRVMEVLSEHNCQGWLEGYVLSGRHGLFATYEAFALIVASMATQHAKWLEVSAALPWRAPVPSLNYLLTSTCWRNDHNGFSHQGPGFMDTILSKKGSVSRVYLPPDANCLLSVADHCLRSHDHVNLIIIDKQPQLQWLDMNAARAHCERGASQWAWAGTEEPGAPPDVVLACAGDVATLETMAAAAWLRENAPELRVRVVNVVDLMTLALPRRHPHGMSAERFASLFTNDTDVVFAFHGYPGAVHQLLHGRPNTDRFHVRGYIEEGTTTTPFDMVVLNATSRFHLAIQAMRRSRRPPAELERNVRLCEEALARHRAYILEHFEDMPEIRGWVWRSH